VRRPAWFLLLALWAAPAHAADDEALADEVDAFAGSHYEPAVAVDPVHAIFYKEDPDRFAFDAGVWWVRLKGPVKLGSNEDLDVSDTLGLRARKAVPYMRSALRLGWLEIAFSAFWYENQGSQVVDTEFEIDGVVFEVGDVIDSSIKIHAYTLNFEACVMRRDWMTLNLLLGATAIYTEGKIRAVNVEKEARWDVWLPLPLIGVSVSGYLWHYPWFYEASFGWIGFSRKALGAAAVDVRAAIGYEVNDWVNLRAGFRFLGIRADIDEVGAQIDLSGFYIELGFTF